MDVICNDLVVIMQGKNALPTHKKYINLEVVVE